MHTFFLEEFLIAHCTWYDTVSQGFEATQKVSFTALKVTNAHITE